MGNPSTQAALPHADPAALLAIKNLELRAKIVVQGLWNGLHRSPYFGSSVEFAEYRHYSHGDDLRYMDWKLYGRSDRYYIKKFRDETNLRCFLLTDLSRSMTYGSRGYSKSEYARTLAATLAYFLHLQGDAVGLMTFDDEVRDYFPAKNQKSHLRQLILALERPSQARSTNIQEPLQRALDLVRRRSLFVLVSDFMAPLKVLQEKLPLLMAHGHEGVLFQVLDPAEQQFDLGQAALFEDLESGKQLFINPVQAKERYQERMAEHNRQLMSLCDACGVPFITAPTHEPVEKPLLDFLRRRMQERNSGRTKQR
ncbi:MAG TPA: DUF58 domain-containing protein [Methylomirabilota bacterium]|nr:DUF58 domain-containing protein [Methylomirabilota bacterium]